MFYNSTLQWFEWLNEDTRRALNTINFLVYEVLPYPYFLLGVAGHSRSIYKCYQLGKTESGYLLQMFFSIVRIMEILGFMLLIFVFNRWASVANGPGAHWYRRHYVLMWLAAHLIIPMANGLINASMFMSICISLDRAASLGRPGAYRARWHKKRYRVGALVLSLVLGFGLVAYDVGRLYPKQDPDGLYVTANNYDYQQSTVVAFFNVIKNCAHFGGLAALIACNSAVVRLYRSQIIGGQHSRTSHMDTTDRSSVDLQREDDRRRAERTLCSLSVCQNLTATFSVSVLVIMYLLDYFLVGSQRWGVLDLGWPLSDGALMLTVLLDFYVPVLVSRQLRSIMFPCLTRNLVQPIELNQRPRDGIARF